MAANNASCRCHQLGLAGHTCGWGTKFMPVKEQVRVSHSTTLLGVLGLQPAAVEGWLVHRQCYSQMRTLALRRAAAAAAAAEAARVAAAAAAAAAAGRMKMRSGARLGTTAHKKPAASQENRPPAAHVREQRAVAEGTDFLARECAGGAEARGAMCMVMVPLVACWSAVADSGSVLPLVAGGPRRRRCGEDEEGGAGCSSGQEQDDPAQGASSSMRVAMAGEQVTRDYMRAARQVMGGAARRVV